MLQDRYGNPVSTNSTAALAKYNEALELIRLYHGDPIAVLDAALEEDPDFGGAWAARAGLFVQQTDKAYLEATFASLRAGAEARLNDFDRAHLTAAQDWAEGRYHAATSGLALHAREHPRDLLAIQFAHVNCFLLGVQHELRDFPLQGLRAFNPGDDGYGALLGMMAFGYEECGDYHRAEELGRRSVEIDPRDGWAVHAVAHVNEMRGDIDEGMSWLADNAKAWAPESGFAYHNWWHLALLHMDRGDNNEALRLYDEEVRPDPNAQVVMECIDASALLWRLHLQGVDVGDRFTPLADAWSRAAEDGIYAFNDLHAVMAFIGAGRMQDVERTLNAMRRVANGSGDNAIVTSAVGLPLAEGFAAFAEGRYRQCVEKICATRGVAQRFGGSHAQRDILTLTAIEAALRGGMPQIARSLAFERTTHKPQSPWAGKLAQSANELEGTSRAA